MNYAVLYANYVSVNLGEGKYSLFTHLFSWHLVKINMDHQTLQVLQPSDKSIVTKVTKWHGPYVPVESFTKKQGLLQWGLCSSFFLEDIWLYNQSGCILPILNKHSRDDWGGEDTGHQPSTLWCKELGETSAKRKWKGWLKRKEKGASEVCWYWKFWKTGDDRGLMQRHLKISNLIPLIPQCDLVSQAGD